MSSDGKYRPWRIEIRGVLEPATPFRIGSGQDLDVRTDAPILLDSQKRAYVLGSSLRGVIKHWLRDEAPLLCCSKTHWEELFGRVPENATDEHMPVLGRLTIEDATAEDAKSETEIRDHVRIDPKTGAAAEGAKFDAEVALPGAHRFRFRAAYEGAGLTDDAYVLLEAALRRLMAGELRVGGKTGLGYGQMRLKEVSHRVFDRGVSAGLAEWFRTRIEPKPEDDDKTWHPDLPTREAEKQGAPSDTGFSQPVSALTFNLRLHFEGPMLVRAALPPPPRDRKDLPGLPGNSETYGEHGELVADSVFIKTQNNYYLPGSSVRGVLRSHAERIAQRLGVASATRLFGPSPGNDDKRRGLIEVYDGELDGQPTRVYLDHVAIDRITNAATDAAKFSTSALASPRFDCRIRICFREADLDAVRMWGFLLRDLTMPARGALWFGASTSRGYGYLHHAEIREATLDLVGEFAEKHRIGEPDTATRRWTRSYENAAFTDFGPLWSVLPTRKGGSR